MTRVAAHPILDLILNRWSPRAMNGQPLSKEVANQLFEAARWAPSCANHQPWRFVYGLGGTPAFEKLFGLLAAGNKPWCQRAGALICVVSKKVFDNGKPAFTYSFDTGAAWMALALQGSSMGLVVHGMAGFDYEAAPKVLHVPEDHRVEAMVAVGYPGNKDDLPEAYRAREVPNDRKPIEELVLEGEFPST